MCFSLYKIIFIYVERVSLSLVQQFPTVRITFQIQFDDNFPVSNSIAKFLRKYLVKYIRSRNVSVTRHSSTKSIVHHGTNSLKATRISRTFLFYFIRIIRCVVLSGKIFIRSGAKIRLK